MHAIHHLLPSAALAGVEINAVSAAALRSWGKAEVFEGSLFDFVPDRRWDLVFTSGVLIHIHPEKLSQVYGEMERAAARYVCISEYYNSTPVAVSYRGHDDFLFKRDFAGEFLNLYPAFSLADYGFTYHRDPVGLKDDLMWFLLERRV